MKGARRQAVVLGLFVTLGAVLCAGGVLAVGDLRETFGRKVIVHTAFPDVHGLQVGANVWCDGVKVGTVRDVRFGGRDRVEVDLAIEPAAVPYIPADAKTKVGSDALLGNRIVVLYEGDSPASIAAGAVLSAGEGATTEDMLAMLEENNRNLVALTTDLRRITADLVAGKGTAGRLLADPALYDDLRTGVAELGSASVRARDLADELTAFAEDLNREGGLPQAVATDRETWPQISESARNLEVATRTARALVASVDEAASAEGAGTVGALLHDEATRADLATTIGNLDRASRLLAEDLEALQHNFLFRGWFRKRERERARRDRDPAPEPEEAPAPATDAQPATSDAEDAG